MARKLAEAANPAALSKENRVRGRPAVYQAAVAVVADLLEVKGDGSGVVGAREQVTGQLADDATVAVHGAGF